MITVILKVKGISDGLVNPIGFFCLGCVSETSANGNVSVISTYKNMQNVVLIYSAQNSVCTTGKRFTFQMERITRKEKSKDYKNIYFVPLLLYCFVKFCWSMFGLNFLSWGKEKQATEWLVTKIIFKNVNATWQ